MTSEGSFQIAPEMGDSVGLFGDPEGFFFIEDRLELEEVQSQKDVNKAKGASKRTRPIVEKS